MNRTTLIGKLARLETAHRARTGSGDSRAKVEAAREQVAEVLAAFPTEPMPKASVVIRLAAAISAHDELRQAFERMAARGDQGAVVMLEQADRWISDNAGDATRADF